MVNLEELGESELKRIQTAPDDFFERLKKVTSKRGRFVVDQILDKGYCTTSTIQDANYDHPPRAARDVRENGIDLITDRYLGPDGKRLGVYHFGNFDYKEMSSKSSGRSVLSNALKKKLIDLYGSKCFVLLEELPEGKLQIDHRIPYEIAGEQDENDPSNFMLLSASANRSKSWECEHCPNWAEKDTSVCSTCFWAHPEKYKHTACRPSREISFALTDPDAIRAYDARVDNGGPHASWEITEEIKGEVERYLTRGLN